MTKCNRDSLVAGGDGERDVVAQGKGVIKFKYLMLGECYGGYGSV